MFFSIMKKFDDALNPIAVKELRQTVNSRNITITVISLLALQLFLMVIFIMQAGESSMGYGEGFFAAVMSALGFICLFGVCATTSQRFAKERKGEGTDVIHSTALTPYQIVWGKLSSAIVMTLFLFSLCMPFLGVSYFMRGVDLSKIVFVVVLAFIALIPLIQFAIFAGSFGNVRLSGGLLVLLIFVSLMVFPSFLFSRGAGISFASADRLAIFGWTFYVAALLTGFAFFASVAMLAPRHSNRAMPLRIYFVGFWVISLIAGLMANNFYGSTVFLILFYVPSIILFSVYAVIAIGERDTQTRRVLKQTPHTRILKLPFYLLSTGRANGLLFSAFFLTLTILIPLLPQLNNNVFDSHLEGGAFIALPMIVALALMYGILSHFTALHIKSRIPKFNAAGPWFFYLILFNLGPMIVSVLSSFKLPKSNDAGMLLFIFSPVILDSSSYRATGLGVSLLCAAGLLMCLIIAELRAAKVYPPPRADNR